MSDPTRGRGEEVRPHPDPDLFPAPHPSRDRRRRLLVTAGGLATLIVIADALFGGPLVGMGLPRQIGGLVLLAGGFIALAGLMGAYRRAFAMHVRPGVGRIFDRLQHSTQRLWGGPAGERTRLELAAGERLALAAGLLLTALDVVLTALLLRDVFPEPPYRLAFLEFLSPTAVEWSFYVSVACFKTVLELWFGVLDGMRGEQERTGTWAALRLFVLGGASAFDAALAASRGFLLAEQGLDGSAVMVSNLVFIAFGLAVPWVAAITGRLLVRAADPLLARFGPLAIVSGLVRLTLVAVLWAVGLTLGLPVLLILGVLALVAAAWFALEDAVALALGQDVGPPPDALVLVERRALPGADRDDPGALRLATGDAS